MTNQDFEQGYAELYDILDEITEVNFTFVDGNNEMFLNLNQVNLCHVSEGETSEHCRVEDGKTKMLIPRINLYTNETNREKYVSSLTFDLLKNEIVRYNVLDSLLNIFNFPVSYTITKTEIILLEKFLLKYFEKIEKKGVNTSYRTFLRT